MDIGNWERIGEAYLLGKTILLRIDDKDYTLSPKLFKDDDDGVFTEVYSVYSHSHQNKRQ